MARLVSGEREGAAPVEDPRSASSSIWAAMDLGSAPTCSRTWTTTSSSSAACRRWSVSMSGFPQSTAVRAARWSSSLVASLNSSVTSTCSTRGSDLGVERTVPPPGESPRNLEKKSSNMLSPPNPEPRPDIRCSARWISQRWRVSGGWPGRTRWMVPTAGRTPQMSHIRVMAYLLGTAPPSGPPPDTREKQAVKRAPSHVPHGSVGRLRFLGGARYALAMPFGRYAVFGEDGKPVGTEEFRCAPGPMGWRYFGQVETTDPSPHHETLDFAVDADWRIARVRIATGQHDILVEPSPDGTTLAGYRDNQPIEIPYGPDVHLDYFTPATNAITARRLTGTTEIDVAYLAPVTLEPTRVR